MGYYLCMTPEKDLAKVEKDKKYLYCKISWNVDVLVFQWSTLRIVFP